MTYTTFKIFLGKIMILFIVAGFILLYTLVDSSAGTGFAAGCIVMLINWRLLAYQNEKILSGNAAPKFAYMFYFFRYSLIFAVAFAAFKLLKPYGGYFALAGILFSLLYAFVFALITLKKEGSANG